VRLKHNIIGYTALVDAHLKHRLRADEASAPAGRALVPRLQFATLQAYKQMDPANTSMQFDMHKCMQVYPVVACQPGAKACLEQPQFQARVQRIWQALYR
jgi:hypothetical protein